MINTVIFDFGQVLGKFDPVELTRPDAESEEDLRLLSEVAFDRRYWDRMDNGTITREEIMDDIATRLPERLVPVAEHVLANWIYRMPEVPGMRELICDLKRKGIRCFYLSNISRYFAEHPEANPILLLMDGGICSATVGLTKPHREIFELLLSRYGIDPACAVFVDDFRKNLDGAAETGLSTYLFDGSAEALRAFLSAAIGTEL